MGCASELATSARTDDLATFKRKLDAARQASPPKPDAEQLREVAQVVASRELVTARAAVAEASVVEVATCASPLEGALSRLSERRDPVGALATQVLIDAGHFDGDLDELVELYASHVQDDWRAVGLRAAVARVEDARRIKGFLDPDLRVRRAALRASKDARSPGDLPHLFEAARLDPDRVSRRFALEAIGEFGSGADVSRLRELWTAGDEAERLVLVDVWVRNRAVEAERQLTWVLSSQTGLPRLSAAAALLRRQAVEVRQWAEEVLTSAVESGPVEESRHALEVAPRTPKIEAAIRAAAKDKDEGRAIGAAIALSQSKVDAAVAVKRLKELRASPNGEVANAATFALAVAGEPDANKWVDDQLTAKDPERRLAAGFVKLAKGGDGQVSKAATLLADPDALVRLRFACWALRDELPKFDYFSARVRP